MCIYIYIYFVVFLLGDGGVQAHLSDASDDPLTRIGLRSPTADSLNNVAFTFSGYHAVRRSAPIKNLQATLLAAQNESRHPEYPDPRDPFWAANLHQFVAAYRAEALALKCACWKGIGPELEAFFGVDRPIDCTGWGRAPVVAHIA